MQIEGICWVYSRSQEKNYPSPRKHEGFCPPHISMFQENKDISLVLLIAGRLIQSQKCPSPMSDGKYCCSGEYAAAYLPEIYDETGVFIFFYQEQIIVGVQGSL